MAEPLEIVEVRESGGVRAAIVLSLEDRAARLVLPDGREARYPLERIVHHTGVRVAAAGAAGPELARWERDAAASAKGVDLATLHEVLLAESEPGRPASLGDLAALALGRDDGASRAAVHRALAAPNAWFRFDGRRWHALPPEDVERELARQRHAAELAARREGVVAVARRRWSGEEAPWPEDAAKFLRPLRELAVDGEASRAQREASQLLAEIQGTPTAHAPSLSPDGAFEAAVRLGLFHRDENLALLRAGVRLEFEPELLAEAEELARLPLDPERRLDLRALEIVTIDDASTTEIDDGLSFERVPGGVRLGIHVADAAHHVLPGTRVDEEALLRGTSYYVPERSLPMVPPVLGEGAASLVAGADRPALSFFVELTPHAEIRRTEVRESLVRVARRMTYDEAEDVLAGTAAGLGWLREAAALAEALERERLAAGATPIRAPELRIDFDAAGEPLLTLLDPGRPARRLVSEMMILANRVCAELCRDRGLPAIYRKQAPADPSVPRPPLDRYDPVSVARFRRALQRTEVSLEPGPHSGLGLPCYLQATSPIRRYQDLAVHRLVKASLRGQPLPHSRDEMLVIAASTEQSGRTARQVENDTDDYWIARSLEKRVGETLNGVLVRAEERRSWVELPEFARQFPLAPRPDHAPGREVRVRLRSVRTRPPSLTFEELR